jgi:hypothetical protein
MLVPFAIGAQRGVVVHAARHVSPMAGLDPAVSRFFEIHDVESLARIGDYIGGFRGTLAEGALLKEGGDSAERGDIRTGR